MDKLIAATLANLEEIAKLGRPGWEALAEAIANSDESDEIQSWLGTIGDGEI